MNSVLRYIFLTIVLSLMCTSTFATPTAPMMDAKTLFNRCKFDPKFEYNTSSVFKVHASNPFDSAIQWTYYFDVRNQTVSLKHERRGPPKETLFGRFNYKTTKGYVLCADADLEANNVDFDINGCPDLPGTFPPEDSEPCGTASNEDGDFFSFYSEDYDFWFTIKVTSKVTCQMHEIGLPGQIKPKGTCFLGKDIHKKWIPVNSFPDCFTKQTE